jgi:transcription antitermination factor NusA-like protein
VAEHGVSIKNQNSKAHKSAKKSTSKVEAQKQMDCLRQKHNQELLQILEEEQNNEAEREIKLKSVADEAERRRLEKIFGIERAKASERIVTASS